MGRPGASPHSCQLCAKEKLQTRAGHPVSKSIVWVRSLVSTPSIDRHAEQQEEHTPVHARHARVRDRDGACVDAHGSGGGGGGEQLTDIRWCSMVQRAVRKYNRQVDVTNLTLKLIDM
jgi:hypothetical protein